MKMWVDTSNFPWTEKELILVLQLVLEKENCFQTSFTRFQNWHWVVQIDSGYANLTNNHINMHFCLIWSILYKILELNNFQKNSIISKIERKTAQNLGKKKKTLKNIFLKSSKFSLAKFTVITFCSYTILSFLTFKISRLKTNASLFKYL